MGTPRTVSKTKSNRKHYDQLNIRIRKDGADEIILEEIREAASYCNESINGFVLEAIRERVAQLRRGW